MIIGRTFVGDDNDLLMMAQHDIYINISVGMLFRVAANRYLLDIRYTWEYPDFVPIIRTKSTFDHRVLQTGHDIIAAYYRFLVKTINVDPPFPDGFDVKRYYTEAWKEYFSQEVELLVRNEAIAELIVSAAAFENTERGYAAEEELTKVLKERYSAMEFL